MYTHQILYYSFGYITYYTIILLYYYHLTLSSSSCCLLFSSTAALRSSSFCLCSSSRLQRSSTVRSYCSRALRSFSLISCSLAAERDQTNLCYRLAGKKYNWTGQYCWEFRIYHIRNKTQRQFESLFSWTFLHFFLARAPSYVVICHYNANLCVLQCQSTSMIITKIEVPVIVRQMLELQDYPWVRDLLLWTIVYYWHILWGDITHHIRNSVNSKWIFNWLAKPFYKQLNCRERCHDKKLFRETEGHWKTETYRHFRQSQVSLRR